MNDVNSFGIINQQELTNKITKKFSLKVPGNPKKKYTRLIEYFSTTIHRVKTKCI